jgi:hypothetical protein
MPLYRTMASLLAVLCLTAPAVAQTAPTDPAQDPEKQKEAQQAREKKGMELLGQVTSELAGLKLPENRIRLQAASAQILWKHDQPRARTVMKEAASGLIAMIASLDPGDAKYDSQLQQVWQLRWNLVTQFANLDASMGLELLRATKVTPSSSPDNPGRPAQWRNMDSQLESQLASTIAATDPRQALEIAEAARKNGLSYQLTNILSALLQSSDMSSASKLAGDIAADIGSADLSSDNMAFSVAINLLRMAAGGASASDQNAASPVVLLSSDDMKNVIDRLSAAALGTNAAGGSSGTPASQMLSQLQPIMPLVQQYDPGQAPPLSQKIGSLPQPPQDPNMVLAQTAIQGTLNDILSTAAKVDAQTQYFLYQQATYRAASEGDLDQVRKIISDNVQDPAAREQLLDRVEQKAALRARAAGKVEAARQAIYRLRSKEQQIEALAELAQSVANRGDKKLALQLIGEAQSLLPPRAEDYRQLNMKLTIARVASGLDPSKIPDAFDSISNQLNALTDGAAALEGFEVPGSFRDGEMLLESGSQLSGAMSGLADAIGGAALQDPAKAIQAAASVQRPEAALLVRFNIAKSLLSQ